MSLEAVAAPAFLGLPAQQQLRCNTPMLQARLLGATPSRWRATGKALGEGTATHPRQRAREKCECSLYLLGCRAPGVKAAVCVWDASHPYSELFTSVAAFPPLTLLHTCLL